ncbi:MAG: fused MFS/spermidine synthase [Verrucomicrobia bacterium]|nr:fused MFS/spermidine synthase [Verrucomicrobiota bacterium]
MIFSARRIFAVVAFCFLVSGMAGLVYQTVWARYLALFLGHTSYAVVAVLVAFMGGLALGNAWFGIRADRSEKPLALYGWLEIGIGIYALLFPSYYTFCHDSFIFLAREWQPGSDGLLALKFVFSFLTILLPTFLMGATFPVLTKFVTRSLAELREKVAALYCINSAGAVLGCLVTDFWWIPAIGLEMTVFAGAALNLAVGLVALYVSNRIREGSSAATSVGTTAVTPDEPTPSPLPGGQLAPTAPNAAPLLGGAGDGFMSREQGRKERGTLHNPSSEEQFSEAELRVAIVAIGFSGFVAMLYEVAWTRLLALALGSSTHAFSLMLVTFITGIAVGAWIVYAWKNLRRTFEAFAWAELALAGTLFVSMFFYEYLPYWFMKLASVVVRDESTYPVYHGLQALVCFSVMFIPTVCLGMTLPLASRIATAELARTGRSVGKVFAVNTLGTVLGAVITGLWLMPAAGLARTLAVGIAVNALIGAAMLARGRLTLGRAVLAPLLGAGFVWFAGLMFDQTWQQTFSLGLWRNRQTPPNLDTFRRMVKNETLTFHRDGAGSTVTVITREENGKEQIGLKVNGKADAGTSLDMTTQLLSGHIPMLLRPSSTNVLVIGLGSGMTCSAVARHPGVQRIDLVEISPDVVEAARQFRKYNDDVHNHPRVRFIIEDAKSFLKITDAQYDLIVSEPSNPWMAGVAGVFSREYYESCRDRLKPDGLMAQWVQIYETSDEALNTVLATFGSVFPHFSIWHPAVSDLILVGSTQPHKIDVEAIERQFYHSAVKSDLERIEITRVPVLLAREVVSDANGVFVPPAEVTLHSDLFPTLEYSAQKAFFVGRSTLRWREFDETFWTRPGTLLGQYLRTHPLTESDYKALGRFYMEYRLPEPDLFRSILVRWQREKPEATLPMELMAQASEAVPTAELEALRTAPLSAHLFRLAETDPEPLRMYASYLMQTYRAHRSAFYLPPSEELQALLQRLIETNPSNQRVYKLHQAELAWDRGDDAAFAKLSESAFDPDTTKWGPIGFSADPRAPRIVLGRMVENLWRIGKFNEAWQLGQDAKRNRYTGTYPLLDMVCRKAEAYSMATR